jgi:hypothetical protein
MKKRTVTINHEEQWPSGEWADYDVEFDVEYEPAHGGSRYEPPQGAIVEPIGARIDGKKVGPDVWNPIFEEHEDEICEIVERDLADEYADRCDWAYESLRDRIAMAHGYI